MFFDLTFDAVTDLSYGFSCVPKKITRSGRHKLESVSFVISYQLLSVKMVYSSSEPKFISVSGILK